MIQVKRVYNWQMILVARVSSSLSTRRSTFVPDPVATGSATLRAFRNSVVFVTVRIHSARHARRFLLCKPIDSCRLRVGEVEGQVLHELVAPPLLRSRANLGQRGVRNCQGT